MNKHLFLFKFPTLVIKSWAAPMFILLGLVVLWEFWTLIGEIPKWQLPAPSAIVKELMVSWGILWKHTYVTFQEVIVGFMAALVSGLFLATIIAYSKVLEKALYPIIISSQTIPIVAIAPLLLIWVGYGIASKAIVVALISFYPITVNTIDGLKAVDSGMINMMRTLGATHWQIFTKLQVPTSLPYMFTGIKVGISISVLGAVIGEWVGASSGLGYLITYSQSLFLTARVFAAIVILSIMGILLFLLASLVERLSIPWQYKNRTADQIRKA